MKSRIIKEEKALTHHISLDVMGYLMFAKRERRETKKEMHAESKERKTLAPNAFNTFVISCKTIDAFFKKLKNNINEFPNPTRFQIAVFDDANEHWLLVDCYIKNHKLCTFTLDAFIDPSSLSNILPKISNHFPTGDHYTFLKQAERPAGGIQTSRVHCQAFVREHAALISNINPDLLYEKVLKENVTKPSLSMNAKNVKFFTIESLTDKMQILTPLFRSTQSFTNISDLPKSFGDTIVSHKRNLILDEFTELHATFNEEKKLINGAIKSKDRIYARKVQELFLDPILLNEAKNFDRTGIGFVSLPVLIYIMPLLALKSRDNILKTIQTVSELLTDNALGLTSCYFFKSKQLNHINKFIAKLSVLTQTCEAENYSNSKVVRLFTDVIYSYAAYLQKQKLQLAFETLSVFFNNLLGQLQRLESNLRDGKRLS